MILEGEFITYLSVKFVSPATGRPYSKKAASDQRSRCRRVEKFFSINLSFTNFSTQDQLDKLINKIKENPYEFGASRDRPYGYAQVCKAIKLYFEFLTLQHKNKK